MYVPAVSVQPRGFLESHWLGVKVGKTKNSKLLWLTTSHIQGESSPKSPLGTPFYPNKLRMCLPGNPESWQVDKASHHRRGPQNGDTENCYGSFRCRVWDEVLRLLRVSPWKRLGNSVLIFLICPSAPSLWGVSVSSAYPLPLWTSSLFRASTSLKQSILHLTLQIYESNCWGLCSLLIKGMLFQ